MTFVFPLLLGGLAVVGVPVLLHLIMRQKPKQLPFPAFRFLLRKHRTNLRKLRLRHLLLLILRVLLLAAICLALTRPRIASDIINFGGDQKVAAVFIFDTRFNMSYQVEDKEGRKDLLELAKSRARELLDDLPEGSLIEVLDTADSQKSWLPPFKRGKDEARKHIDRLKPRPANYAVSEALAVAYRALDNLARDKDEARKNMPRFVYVFSNRTQSSWDNAPLKKLQEEADQIPPPFERLQRMSERATALIDVMQPLPEKLPLSGGPALAEQLGKLRDYAATASAADYPDLAGSKQIAQVRGQVRELIRQAQALGNKTPADAPDFKNKLLGALQTFLRDFKGAYEVFIDVGIDNPLDLAVDSLELPPLVGSTTPRQVFGTKDRFRLQATVRATGTAYNSHIDCLLDGKLVDQKPLARLQPGPAQPVAFDIDCDKLKLARGIHQIEVRVPSKDGLKFDDSRFLTFAIRKGRKVMAIADDFEQAKAWWAALVSSGEFDCEVLSGSEFVKLAAKDLRKYHAICLFPVAQLNTLWGRLADYVASGGGLAVMPPESEKTRTSYNEEAAQKLLPGRLIKNIKTSPGPGVEWDWNKPAVFQRGLLKPFQKWASNSATDFMKVPRTADRYWQVAPKKKGADVLIRYRGKPGYPALVETLFPGKKSHGRVVLFTTPLQGQSEWNNYMEVDSSFAVMLPHLTMRYLAGNAAGVKLSFLSGEPVVVPLPAEQRRPPYYVEGPMLEDARPVLEPPRTDNVLRVKGAVRPGNYPITDKEQARIAGFSVNVPAAECDLTRVPEEQIVALFGPKSVVSASSDVKLRDALRDHWSQPVELLPVLLVLLLLTIVLESFLANKFYRRDPDNLLETARPERELS